MAPFTKEKAVDSVQAIIERQITDYELGIFEKFRLRTKLRSKHYNGFYVLCHKNTHKSTAWLVCRYVIAGGCKLAFGIHTFNTTNGGTGRLERHAKLHENKNDSRLNLPRPLPSFSKAQIARGAALSVAFDLSPLSFTENKRGMNHFVSAVFRAGQALPVNDHIDPSTILPSTGCVTRALKLIWKQTRDEYKDLILQKMYETGGDLSTDGVSLKVQDRQFQDLTVHFIEVTGSNKVNVDAKVEMKVATLLLKEKPAAGDAASIRAMLGSYLLQHYDKDIDWLTKRFTMVTDCASVMARVALSSVSANVAPMSEKWMGCLAHQLSTAMKCCVESLNEDLNYEMQIISDDLQRMKKIVPIFKQSGWNGQLPNGFHLIQECETRFGTTLTLAHRFLKSAVQVESMIERKNSVPAKEAFSGLLKDAGSSGRLRFPAVEAITEAFQIIDDAQTKVQAANTPTVHIALPLLQSCRDELERIADGGTVWREEEKAFIPSTPYSRKLCRSLLHWLDLKVRIHDLWLVGCYLHPFLREFQFVSAIEKRREFKTKAESRVRALIMTYMEELQPATDAAETLSGTVSSQPSTADVASVRTIMSGNDCTVAGRKRTFYLMRYADSHFHPTALVDEVSRYNVIDMSVLGLEKKKFMEDDFSAVKFWYRRKGTFPNMYKVACRVYATPVSSCASERVFSALNRIISSDRASTSAETLEDIIVIRSMLS